MQDNKHIFMKDHKHKDMRMTLDMEVSYHRYILYRWSYLVKPNDIFFSNTYLGLQNKPHVSDIIYFELIASTSRPL